MIGRRRNGGMSLGRVAKKAAVATVVNRVVNNAMDNRMGNNVNRHMHQQPVQQQPILNNICPSCNTGNPQHAKFCLNCGGGFATTAPQQQQAPSLSHCPGCKANLAGITGNFCPYCRSAIR
ncbi:MAG: zinc ribbon domain-containing protein [Defluviitaleaceae bacterium]|nr:zinc ribbon domain-containing protein [Defluviitaleaceae bacterium]